ncbi:NAD(P)-dependent oxidoreductase [Actinocorallia populi]|uniref:NAD(P)-dependent oxidoreductase n=1 Tax=Actinocorallia populi TaxID=2079200 RepID=UPI000D0951AC|nr:NAD(P)-dependent oxidoreductase [Actinocorallia populi]
MHVGFIGLGSQGAPMARRIIDAGYDTTLWARRAATLEAFTDTPAKTAGTPAELAAACDIVCVCVVNDTDVEEVLTGKNGVLDGLRSGGVIAIHSTVHPDTCRKLAEPAGKQGIRLVDAPVSGGGGAAAEGRLLVLAGGDTEAVELCRPVFATYASPIIHTGALGSAQLTKLLNNLLFTAHLATAASTLALGRQLGIDTTALAQAITHGTGTSFALTRVTAAGGTLDRMAPVAGPLLQKDARLITELARTHHATPGTVLTAADDALDLMNHRR